MLLVTALWLTVVAALTGSVDGNVNSMSDLFHENGRCPHGQRGLKQAMTQAEIVAAGRCPHGQRGLKLHRRTARRRPRESLPSRAAWIETASSCRTGSLRFVAALTGSVDGNRGAGRLGRSGWLSLPSRAAWIETGALRRDRRWKHVAALTGSVDGNVY